MRPPLSRSTPAARLTILIVVFCSFPAPCDGAGDEVTARAIIAAWKSHREGFTRFACSYRHESGRAADPIAADNLEFAVERMTEVMWAVDSTRERLSEHPKKSANVPLKPGPAPAGQDGQTSAVTEPFTRHFLRNGDYIANGHGDPVSVLTIFGPSHPSTVERTVSTPFSVGAMGPGESSDPESLVESAVRGGEVVFAEVESESIATITIGPEDVPTTTFVFDPARDMLLTRMAFGGGGRSATCEVREAKHTAQGWFPTDALRVIRSGDSECLVDRWIVTKLEVGALVQDVDFSIPMAKGAFYNSDVDEFGQLSTASAMNAGPELLETWYRDLERNGLKMSAYVAAKESVAPASASRRWWFIAAGAVLALGAVWSLLRLRRARNS